jgi:hypothetical protein
MECERLTVNTRPGSLFGVLIIAIALTGPVVAESSSSYELLDAAPKACAHDVCTDHLCGCASSPLSRAADRWYGTTSRLEESGIKFEGELSQFYQGVASGGIQQKFRFGIVRSTLILVHLMKIGPPFARELAKAGHILVDRGSRKSMVEHV